MENQDSDRRNKGYTLMRTIMDYGMGIMIFGFGVLFLLAPKLGFSFEVDGLIRYSFGCLCIIYGGWRIYRGYKKNYFH